MIDVGTSAEPFYAELLNLTKINDKLDSDTEKVKSLQQNWWNSIQQSTQKPKSNKEPEESKTESKSRKKEAKPAAGYIATGMFDGVGKVRRNYEPNAEGTANIHDRIDERDVQTDVRTINQKLGEFWQSNAVGDKQEAIE